MKVPTAAPRLAWAPVLAVTATVVTLLLVTSQRYGYHRDELYFLSAGRRPAWGYPDQPPLTPMLARAMDTVFTGSLAGLRLPSVLATASIIVLSAMIARELGGGRFAQGLAAVTVGLGLIILLLGHLLSTATFDVLVWVALTWLVVRILRTGEQRLWLVAGVVAGAGLLNKDLPVLLLGGLAVGALLTPVARRQLTSPWLWAGAGIAALMWTPYLIWQAQHSWPQLELAEHIRAEYGVAEERLNFILLQLVMFSFGATVLWIWGLVRLWRYPAWRVYRVLAWAWVVLVVLVFATAGKGYYLAGLYPALIAAGAVGVEARLRNGRWWVLAGVVVSSLLLLPGALPVLSSAALSDSPYAVPGEDQLETVGWPAFVDAVNTAYQSIPADQRSRAVIFTGNYGEAGAIERFGPARGLPPVYSGHNGFGLWGPPPDDSAPVIVVDTSGPPSQFPSCRLVTRVDTGEGVDNEEQGAGIYVCDAPSGGWRAAWPTLTHLDA